MPYLIQGRCADPSCGHLAIKYGRCETHQPRWTDSPPSHSSRIPGPIRDAFRTAVLTRDPVCAACNTSPSTEADHVIPVSQGGSPSDPANGQGLCHRCHTLKTQTENANRLRLKHP